MPRTTDIFPGKIYKKSFKRGQILNLDSLEHFKKGDRNGKLR